MNIPGKKAVITPECVLIIATYDENGMPNAMNAAWGMQSDMGEITIMLGKHKTTDNFEKTGAFTVSFATAGLVRESDYFGVVSGNDVPDKITHAGLHTHKADHVNAPIIDEYPLTLECRVRSWDPESGYLIGKIVTEHADDAIITDGHVDLGKLKPIIYDPGMNAYRVVGDIVGKAFSDGLQLK